MAAGDVEYVVVGKIRIRTTGNPDSVMDRVEGALISEFLTGLVDVRWQAVREQGQAGPPPGRESSGGALPTPDLPDAYRSGSEAFRRDYAPEAV